ncbi:MAG TPA: hypothetical protein VMZ33_06145 [Candidatus Limnocylindrales bacterium]|nr:hypothetical protein [Candidatus Limnocylindrales bacterium]
MTRYIPRFAAIIVALAIMVAATGVVLAATSAVTGNAQKQIKVVRENTTTASATSNSTTYSDIPGATVSMTVPSSTNALLVARFQSHGSVIQTSGCIVRILVGSTTMEPNGNYPFMGQANVSESVAGSGAIERSLAVGPGTYTVKAQLRIATANSVNSQCQLSGWHFAVERHARS